MTAQITPIRTAAETGLLAAFAALRPSLPGGAAIAACREKAFGRFQTQGLPHRHVEEWKYTDLRALMHDAKPLAPPPDQDGIARAEAMLAGPAGLPGVEARRLVFVDGAFVAALSDLADPEPGLRIVTLAQALRAGDPQVTARLGTPGPAEGDVVYALNTAFMGDGAIIEVAQDAHVARPVHLVFLYGSDRAGAVFPRSHVTLARGAGLTLVESHHGPDGLDYQVNAALDVSLGDRARLDHFRIGREGADALHLSTVSATIGAGAEYFDLGFTAGGRVVRNQLMVLCAGANAMLGLYGATLLAGRQHADTTLLLDHAAGGCRSRELFKSALDGSSRGVFQGKIIVRPGAQKTDARMMTRALLLSEDAEADNKPELEIFADDVQCGHGATSGALDDTLKFYLMARGIPEPDAETLLIQSFIGEVIEAARHEGIRDALMEATTTWLANRQ